MSRYLTIDSEEVPKINIGKVEEDMILEITKIEEIISTYDKVEILARLLHFDFVPEGTLQYNRFKDSGALIFVTGLCIKKSVSNGTKKIDFPISTLIETVLRYFELLNLQIIYKSQLSAPETQNIIFHSLTYNLLNKVNYGGYQHQFDDFTNYILPRFDQYFNELGISYEDSKYFANLIKEYYERKHYERSKSVRTEFEKEKVRLIRENQIGRENEKNLQAKFTQKFIENFKSLFVFKPEDIIPLDNPRHGAFKSYLKVISCEFADPRHDHDYRSPLDTNIIYSRPVLSLGNDEYFCPKVDLLFDYHIILPGLLPKEGEINQKFIKLKSKYLEDRMEECLLRLFPREAVHRNLYYFQNGEKYEVDLLVHLNDTIIVIEAKSGAISDSGLTGGYERLKSDLGKIIKKGDLQGRRTIEFIKGQQKAIFYNENKQKILLEIDNSPGLEFIRIILTLVPLRGLGIDIEDIKELDLLSEKDIPLYFSIFDFETITNFLPLSSVLVHYLQDRSARNDVNFLFAYNELQYLGWYLKNLNFGKLRLNRRDWTSPDSFSNYLDPFERHYLYNDVKPTINLPDSFLNLLKGIEETGHKNFFEINKNLLETNENNKTKIIRKIDEKILKIKKDGKNRYFSRRLDPLNCGLTYMIDKNTKISDNRLIEICTIAKYKTKSNTWIGIRVSFPDVSKIQEIQWLKSDWILDNTLEAKSRNYKIDQ